jgi:HAE1 family hydrophobic/amphiphilic exporter-1
MPDFSIKHPVTTVMLVLIVVILGGMGLLNLKQELMPEMNLGIAIVTASYDGAGPQEIETLVTKPLEETLGAVSNLSNISSTSSDGLSLLVLEFNEGTDMDSAALKMRENIDLVKDYLPDGVEARVLQIDPNNMQSYTLGISGDYDLARLKSILDNEIIKRLEKLEGVASVSDSGGRVREISVELNPDKLLQYHLSAAQIAGLLAAENINIPGGTLRQGDMDLQVRVTGEMTTVEEIKNLPIPTAGGITLRLSDVASVVDGYKKISSMSLINGRPGLSLAISKQSTANIVEVADRINAEIAACRLEYGDLEFVVVLDPSRFVKIALSNVWQSVLMATLLAVIVLFIFLGNSRSSLIVGVAIPISIIASLMLAYFAKLTLNMITLNALVISVGMLVDNSIVVLEAINRHLSQGKDPKTAASDGANEVAMPVVASTLTTVVVFLPVVFVEGIAGMMFGQLGLILLFSLISSLGVALTFVPMACSKFLKTSVKMTLAKRVWSVWDKFYQRLERGYGKLLHWAVRHKKITVLLFFLFVVATGSVTPFMGMNFMEGMDRGMLGVSVETPQGSSLEETAAATDILIERIAFIEEIESISVTIGSGGPLGAIMGGGSHTADIQINLIPKRERAAISVVTDRIREAAGQIAGAEITVSEMGEQMMGAGSGIDLYVFGDDMLTMETVSGEITAIIEKLPAVTTVESSIALGNPQVRVVVDRSKTAAYGLQASQVASAVNMALNGMTATRFKVEGDEIDITVRYPRDHVDTIMKTKNILLATPSGANIPLYEIAEVTEEQGPASITKENLRRHITISAAYTGISLNEIQSAINQALQSYPMPNDFSYQFGGTFETMMESFNSLGLALIIGFILVYMVIASQFESLAYPGTILFSIPIAWTAGIMGLFITGHSIDVMSMVGLILLMGIVVNNGIVLVDYINVKRREGMHAIDAIEFAGPVRLRPILMTTITTVAGLMPMLFASGDGSEMQRPLGAVVSFWLALYSFVTLILIPVLYLILHNFRKKFGAKN